MIRSEVSDSPTGNLETQRARCDGDSVVDPATDGCLEKESSLDISTVWDLLSNDRRRLVILALAEHGRGYEGLGPYVSVGDLAEFLAEVSRNSPTRKAMYVSLHQNHLDTLDDAGVVEYDDRGKSVRAKLPLYKLESMILEMERTIDST
jgi:DNA-binding transcriptional ArsR family regulator